jgi:hypothetical protein
MLGLLGVLLSAGCTEVHGHLIARGAAIGDWDFLPDDCKSGDHQEFYGVDLSSEHDLDRHVRVLVDPLLGDAVVVTLDGPPGARLDFLAHDCAELAVSLDRGGSDRDPDMSGELSLDCSRPDDDAHFRGWASFDNCHPYR